MLVCPVHVRYYSSAAKAGRFGGAMEPGTNPDESSTNAGTSIPLCTDKKLANILMIIFVIELYCGYERIPFVFLVLNPNCLCCVCLRTDCGYFRRNCVRSGGDLCYCSFCCPKVSKGAAMYSYKVNTVKINEGKG